MGSGLHGEAVEWHHPRGDPRGGSILCFSFLESIPACWRMSVHRAKGSGSLHKTKSDPRPPDTEGSGQERAPQNLGSVRSQGRGRRRPRHWLGSNAQLAWAVKDRGPEGQWTLKGLAKWAGGSVKPERTRDRKRFLGSQEAVSCRSLAGLWLPSKVQDRWARCLVRWPCFSLSPI